VAAARHFSPALHVEEALRPFARRSLATLMNEMNPETIHSSFEMRELVERAFDPAAFLLWRGTAKIFNHE